MIVIGKEKILQNFGLKYGSIKDVLYLVETLFQKNAKKCLFVIRKAGTEFLTLTYRDSKKIFLPISVDFVFLIKPKNYLGI